MHINIERDWLIQVRCSLAQCVERGLPCQAPQIQRIVDTSCTMSGYRSVIILNVAREAGAGTSTFTSNRIQSKPQNCCILCGLFSKFLP